MPPPDVLNTAAFHILLALAHGDLHGYGLLRTVREQSGERIVLRTGSLYRHLADLMDRGWVTRHEPPPEADARRSAYFRLTPLGLKALEEQRRYLADVVAVLNAVPLLRKGRV